MENLMFWGMFVACLLISAMTFYILSLQRMVNNDLRRKYNDLERELSYTFGWERMIGVTISASTLAKLIHLINSE